MPATEDMATNRDHDVILWGRRHVAQPYKSSGWSTSRLHWCFVAICEEFPKLQWGDFPFGRVVLIGGADPRATQPENPTLAHLGR